MLALLLLLPLAALPSGTLALHIDSPQRSVLTGEPVKLVATWTAVMGPVKGVWVENDNFSAQSVVFEVRGPEGMGTYRAPCGPSTSATDSTSNRTLSASRCPIRQEPKRRCSRRYGTSPGSWTATGVRSCRRSCRPCWQRTPGAAI